MRGGRLLAHLLGAITRGAAVMAILAAAGRASAATAIDTHITDNGAMMDNDAGGGTGYAWYIGGRPGHGFQGPTDNVVEGVADPNNRYNRGGHRSFRGGRGGGRRPPPP